MTNKSIPLVRRRWRKRHAALLALTALTAPVIAQAQQSGEGTLTLDAITVTAGGFAQTVRDAPASVTIITSEELAKGSFTNLTDAIRNIQGVVATGTANEQDIYIRGLPGQYTLILVDGKRQNTRDARTNGSAGIEQSFIPPIAAIDRIEVVRGPMSSLYGSDAMGGVINVITKPVSDVWTGSMTAETTLQDEAGFKNSRQFSFYAAGPLIGDRLGLQLWARKFDRSASPIPDGLNGSDDYDFGGRLTWALNENNQLMLEAGKTLLTSEDYGDLGYRDNDRRHWSLTHKGQFGDLDTELSLSQEIGERTTYSRTALDTGWEENIRSPEVRNTVVDAKGSRPVEWFGTHNLTFGGQFIHTTVKDQNPGAQADLPEEDRFDEKFSLDEWALYAEDEWHLRDDFILTLGLRYSEHELYGGHITPRIYGVWDATPALTIKGGISTGYRAPDIRTITPGYAYTTGGRGCSGNTPPSCGVILGNPDLEPEQTTNFELGMIYEGTDFTLGATAFHTRFKDKLQQIRTTDQWTDGPQYTAPDGSLHYYDIFRNFNVDRAEITGLELTGDWILSPTLTARANYTYTRSRQKTGDFAGFPLARTPEHMANLRLDWQTPVEGLDSWLSANYHGSEIASGLRIGSNGRPVTINGESGQKYAPYTTVDIGMNYRLTESATVSAALYNVFNKDVQADEFNTVVEGRRLWLGLTSTF
ncbi:TonB-dependent receptor domain-containing protein [Pontibaca methylaminivorans]|uniref:Outer membrane receptor for ferrienterochelin and colicins n=1 Tax=Pontibaca methylaminivorans TaxID=515897 RepID=A0A1R3X8M1_9RHOB|nr:TonB-dependent receptor [Pontibaca methylaminivorans]SIT86762.1 outer membrane receptor for ferrienterochelin and colicins [Pontibaca methylaminivorans]